MTDRQGAAEEYAKLVGLFKLLSTGDSLWNTYEKTPWRYQELLLLCTMHMMVLATCPYPT
jgi:hypothetical protein